MSNVKQGQAGRYVVCNLAVGTLTMFIDSNLLVVKCLVQNFNWLEVFMLLVIVKQAIDGPQNTVFQ